MSADQSISASNSPAKRKKGFLTKFIAFLLVIVAVLAGVYFATGGEAFKQLQGKLLPAKAAASEAAKPHEDK